MCFLCPYNGTINYATPLAAAPRGSLFGHFSVKRMTEGRTEINVSECPVKIAPLQRGNLFQISLPPGISAVGTKSPAVRWDFYYMGETYS